MEPYEFTQFCTQFSGWRNFVQKIGRLRTDGVRKKQYILYDTSALQISGLVNSYGYCTSQPHNLV
jgi:hypothetical protein